MDYVKDALRTDTKDYKLQVSRLQDEKIARLLHSGMGLVTEAGEFMDTLKRHVMYGIELDKVNLAEEIGDIFWYCAVACDELGISFEDVQKKNIEKLKVRYPEKFTKQQAEVRNLGAERKVLCEG